MNAAAVARIGAYLLAVLAATAPALPGSAAGLGAGVPSGDAGTTTEGLLTVGDAYLRIGEAARDRATPWPRPDASS